jgi:hypothetical protein
MTTELQNAIAHLDAVMVVVEPKGMKLSPRDILAVFKARAAVRDLGGVVK